MPRINEEATLEVQAWNAHNDYLAERFPDASINNGWYQDWVSDPPEIASKIYVEAKVVVTLVVSPDFPTYEKDL